VVLLELLDASSITEDVDGGWHDWKSFVGNTPSYLSINIFRHSLGKILSVGQLNSYTSALRVQSLSENNLSITQALSTNVITLSTTTFDVLFADNGVLLAMFTRSWCSLAPTPKSSVKDVTLAPSSRARD
jgi:hypothetical protein